MPAPSSSHLAAILLVDDGYQYRITVKLFLSMSGFAVEVARDAEEALSMFDPKMHDIVMTRQTLPGMSGMELAHIIKLRSRSTPVILFSATPIPDTSCIDRLLNEPTHVLLIRDVVQRLLTERSQRFGSQIKTDSGSHHPICHERWHRRMWGIRQSTRHQERD